MTEKRFTLEEFGLNFIVNANGRNLTAKQTVDKLNQLYEENEELKKENEKWKSIACDNSSFNSILLHELDIAQEQGYKLSDPFKKLMGKCE